MNTTSSLSKKKKIGLYIAILSEENYNIPSIQGLYNKYGFKK